MSTASYTTQYGSHPFRLGIEALPDTHRLIQRLIDELGFGDAIDATIRYAYYLTGLEEIDWEGAMAVAAMMIESADFIVQAAEAANTSLGGATVESIRRMGLRIMQYEMPQYGFSEMAAMNAMAVGVIYTTETCRIFPSTNRNSIVNRIFDYVVENWNKHDLGPVTPSSFYTLEAKERSIRTYFDLVDGEACLIADVEVDNEQRISELQRSRWTLVRDGLIATPNYALYETKELAEQEAKTKYPDCRAMEVIITQ